MNSGNSSEVNGRPFDQISEISSMATDGLLQDEGVPAYAKMIIKQQQALIASLVNIQQQQQESRYASTVSLFQHQQSQSPYVNASPLPPPGISANSPPPGIGHPVAPMHISAPPHPPPGFRAPPGFDVSCAKSDIGSLKPDVGSRKFDLNDELKEAFSVDDTSDNTNNVSVTTNKPTLSPRSLNILEAQTARLPMSSSFSSTENLQACNNFSRQMDSSPSVPIQKSHQRVAAASMPPAQSASFSSSASAMNYLLANEVVLNYEQVHEQKEKWADEMLTMVDRQSSPERSLYQRFANLGAVLYTLQRLHHLHPEGFSVAQYVQFENREKRARPTQEGFFFNNTMPSVASLLESNDDLLRMDIKREKFHVSDEVTRTHLFCLGKNLCSNLFRLLRRCDPTNTNNNAYRVQHLLEIIPQMVPTGTPVPDSNALLDLCNRFPTIFQLRCSPQDNYRFDNSVIMLNAQLLDNENLVWRVVLDTDEF